MEKSESKGTESVKIHCSLPAPLTLAPSLNKADARGVLPRKTAPTASAATALRQMKTKQKTSKYYNQIFVKFVKKTDNDFLLKSVYLFAILPLLL